MSKQLDGFNAWWQDKGFRKLGSAYINDRHQYTFSYHYPDFKTAFYSTREQVASGIFVKTIVHADSFTKEATKELKRALKGVGRLSMSGDICIVQVGGRKADTICQRMEDATRILTEVFTLHGVQAKKECFFCGAGSCDDYIENNMTIYPAHTACRTQTAQALREEVSHNLENGNYILAILAAFVGGIVASIPSLIASLLGWYIGIFFMLIPLGAHFAYKKARGKITGATRFIVSIVSLLCAFTLVLIEFYITIVAAYGVIGIAPFLLLCSYFMEDLLAEAIMPLIFCVIGIFYAWRQIGNENKIKLQQAEELQGTPAHTYDDAAL